MSALTLAKNQRGNSFHNSGGPWTTNRGPFLGYIKTELTSGIKVVQKLPIPPLNIDYVPIHDPQIRKLFGLLIADIGGGGTN